MKSKKVIIFTALIVGLTIVSVAPQAQAGWVTSIAHNVVDWADEGLHMLGLGNFAWHQNWDENRIH